MAFQVQAQAGGASGPLKSAYPRLSSSEVLPAMSALFSQTGGSTQVGSHVVL